MSNRLFSAHCPVTHCAPRRVRRTWGRTLADVLVLLALAALCGWLWSCVRQASGQTGLVAQQQGYLLSMAPVSRGMIGGLVVSLLVVGTVMAVMKVRRNEAFIEKLRAKSKARREFWERGDWPHEVPDFTETETGAQCVRLGMTDLREIVLACRAESRAVLHLIETAMNTMSVDDYGDALAGAQRRLAQVTRTLGELHKSLTPECSHEPKQNGGSKS